MKAGPPDVDAIIRQAEYEASIGNTKKYFDMTFHGVEALESEGFVEFEEGDAQEMWDEGDIYWKSYKEYLSGNSIFSDDGNDPIWKDAN